MAANDAELVVIDEQSGQPPYEQVRAQLAGRITAGSLVAGTRLPPVRQLAERLGLAVNTVARAYRELESAGLVATRGRGGTVVTAAGNRAIERLQAAAAHYAGRARELGIDADQAARLVRAALAESDRSVGRIGQ